MNFASICIHDTLWFCAVFASLVYSIATATWMVMWLIRYDFTYGVKHPHGWPPEFAFTANNRNADLITPAIALEFAFTWAGRVALGISPLFPWYVIYRLNRFDAVPAIVKMVLRMCRRGGNVDRVAPAVVKVVS